DRKPARPAGAGGRPARLIRRHHVGRPGGGGCLPPPRRGVSPCHDGHLGRVERRVMSAIELCRTAALGGHTEACAECGLVRCAYNSCRNRHCPKCQGQARTEWLAARQAELLPVPYFHVVFTLPAAVAEIAYQNKTTVYTI